MFLQQDRRIIFLLLMLAALYAALLAVDFARQGAWPAQLFKYADVCLCLALAAYASKSSRHRADAKLVVLALLFTIAADALFLFFSAYAAGVAVFTGAHLCYVLRYNPGMFRALLYIAAAAVLFCAAAYVLRAGLPFLYILGGAYALLIFNAAAAGAMYDTATQASQHKNSSMPAQASRLFVFGKPERKAAAVAGLVAARLVWTFYVPSQALIALSAGEYAQEAFG